MVWPCRQAHGGRYLFTRNENNMIIKLDKIIAKFDLNIRGVVHIGAHYGQEYVDYARHGIQNMIFFEPILANYEELVSNLPVNDYILTFNMALGNETGQKEMFTEYDNKGQSCSFLEPGTHLTLYPHIKFTGKELVSMDKLDNIVFDRSLYNMINIDVQGYELEVFKGGGETLKFIDIIYTEVNDEDVYKGCCHLIDVDDFLSKLGFCRVLIEYPMRTPTIPYPWGDALYLKTSTHEI
jgi:FkbM family methyltransferase